MYKKEEKMKPVKYGVILLALLLAAMAMVPMVSADKNTKASNSPVSIYDSIEIQDPENDAIGFLPVNRISIDESIKNATPYYVMLTGNDEERQKLFRFIDDSSAALADEKESLKSSLSELWQKYPVAFKKEQTNDGSITYISFDQNVRATVAGRTLSDEENKTLGAVNKIVADSSNAGYITPMWAGYQHGDFIYEACVKSQFPNAAVAQSAADDPDSWPAPGMPSQVPQAIQTAINAVFHSWNHYYNPNLGWGGAPSNTRSFADNASSYYDLGQNTLAAQNLGWSSHFLTDVGNPMHTGKEAEQYADYILGTDIHGIYESYVSSKWGSDTSGLKKVIHDNNNWYMVTPWDSGTQQLAANSNSDLDTLYNEVYYYRDNLNNAPNVYSITYNNILRTAKYTNGLAQWVKA